MTLARLAAVIVLWSAGEVTAFQREATRSWNVRGTDTFSSSPPRRHHAGAYSCVVGQSCALLTAIQDVKGTGSGLCFTTENKFGGLANTVGLVNRVYTFALEHSVHFVFPPIKPNDHDVGDSFENLFGAPRQALNLCQGERLVRMQAVCPGPSRQRNKSQAKCHLKNHTVKFENPSLHAAGCDCQNMLVFDHSLLESNYDFELTHRDMAKKYWQSHSAHMYFPKTYVRSPGSMPITIAVHVRLAAELDKDRLKGLRTIKEKHTDVLWYQAVLRGLFTRLPTKCVQIYILTEKPKHADIFQIRQSMLEEVGVMPTLYGPEVEAAEAFEVMTHADILVAGGSGFSRLAATLRSVMDTPFPACSFCVAKESNFKAVLGGTIIANARDEDQVRLNVERALQLNRPFLQQMADRCEVE